MRFQRPWHPGAAEIERYFSASRDAQWYSNGGPCLRQLTERLESWTGSFCIPVTSGTSGLLLAIRALCHRAGGTEVLVPSFTFAATVQAITWNGLDPVFVDVASDHLHMSTASLRGALASRGERICMVVACSSFGTPPPPEVRREWEAVCREAGVPLVVDSAAGFGAVAADGLPVGGQGDVEVVSFHVTKPYGIGEGGAVFTRDEALAADVRRLGNFGFDGNRQAIDAHGINAKLDELHAAVGLAALDVLGDNLARRRLHAASLLDALSPDVQTQAGHELSTYQFVPVILGDDHLRDRIMEAGRGRVEFRTYYEPLHAMVAFRTAVWADDLEVTRMLQRRALSLPMAVDLLDVERDLIIDVCREGLKR